MEKEVIINSDSSNDWQGEANGALSPYVAQQNGMENFQHQQVTKNKKVLSIIQILLCIAGVALGIIIIINGSGT